MSLLPYSFQLIDAIADPVAITNSEGIFVYCNYPYLDLIAKSSLQVIGFSVSNVLPPAFFELEIAAENSLLHSGAKYISYEMSSNDLHPFDVSASVYKGPISNQDGVTEGFFTIIKVNERVGFLVLRHKFQLTAQEARVFEGLVEGLSVKSIARNLDISNYTVSGHMKELYKKIGVRSRHELQYVAIKAFKNPLTYWRRHFSASDPYR